MRKTCTLILILTSCAAGLQCGRGRPAAVADAYAAPPVKSGNFELALEKARQNEGRDEITRAVEVAATIRLRGRELASLDELKVKADGSLLVVDSERQSVEMFDGEGAHRRAVGARGSRPGHYVLPSGVSESGQGAIAVSDFKAHRVSIFSAEGEFARSFIYTAQKYSAQRITYEPLTKSFYLFGNRWQHDQQNRLVGADLLHKYNEAGEYVGSFIPFPEAAKSLDLYGHDSPALDVRDGHLYLALPFEYKIYRLSPAGELTAPVEGGGAPFRAPATALTWRPGSAPAERVADWQDWRLTWTPIVGLAVEGDALMVQYQTFDPLRYRVDIWSLRGRRKLATLATNHALLTRGADGFVYFLNNLDARGQGQYEIIRARLKRL